MSVRLTKQQFEVGYEAVQQQYMRITPSFVAVRLKSSVLSFLIATFELDVGVVIPS